MAISSIVTAVNGFVNSVSNGFTAFLTINYFVGQGLVSFFSSLVTHLWSALVLLSAGFKLMLEDLSVFIFETCQSIWSGFDFVFAALESVFGCICTAGTSVKYSVISLITSVTDFAGTVTSGVAGVIQTIKNICQLLGASLLLLVSLVPSALFQIYSWVLANLQSVYFLISDSVSHCYEYTLTAPVESFLGLITGLTIVYSTFKLSRKLIRDYNITWRWIIQLILQIVCLLYIQICLILIGLGRGVAKGVEFTLTHLHAPRFHHAGDVSDDEDDPLDNMSINESEMDVENDDFNIRRRNYDLLLKKREEKRRSLSVKKGQGTSKSKGSPNMEELLFEQVEREREDKLCVVCQDREKCIMILPCRHLCICQDCQAPLLRSRNGVPICPICRKLIRQTIKAYL